MKAMQTDDVADTVSYAELCDLIRKEMAVPSRLLEHVVGRMAESIFLRYPEVSALDLSLTKENPPMGVDCAGAGVEVHLINDKTRA